MSRNQPCKSCGAPLVWIKTPAGKWMPCDPAKIVVVTDGGEVRSGRVPHWAICPTAAQHRGQKV